MIIELVGLPGSGKTTFAKTLSKSEGWIRVKISSRTELAYYNFTFFLFHPVSALLQLAWLIRYRGARGRWYTKFMNLFLVHNAKWMKARRIDRAIIDQGHLQNIISLFDGPIDLDIITRYLRVLPRADHALVFAIPIAVAEERMKERGYGVRLDMDPREEKEWLKHASDRLLRLVQLLPERGPAIVVGNDEDVSRVQKLFQAKQVIYYVHNTRMPTEKAHGGQIARMCTEWANLGARVTLLAGFQDKKCAGGGVAAYYGVPENFFVRFIARRSWHELLPRSPKLAYQLNNAAAYARLIFWRPEKGAIIFTRRPELAWLFKMKGVRVVYECHEWYAHGWRLPYYLGTHADLIVCINRYTGEEFAKRGFPKERLMTETNGVLYEAFALSVTPGEARKKVDLPSDKAIMLYTGGLKMMGEDKGVTTILESLRELNDPQTLFVAVGGKPEEIVEFTEKAKQLGVLAQCVFIGRKTREELALYQRAADALLVVHPRTHLFEYYMAPLKTFEYMASGRPIIASDLLSLREIMDDETAFWVEPGNAKDLARAMKEVVSSRDESERRAKNVQVKAKQFTWQARAERLLARFSQLA